MLQLALAVFMSSLGLKTCTKSQEAYQCDQQFGENESIYIGNTQRLQKEGNGEINEVSEMRSGLAKIIGKVHISNKFESP